MHKDESIYHEMKDVQTELIVISDHKEIPHHRKCRACHFDLFYFQSVNLVKHFHYDGSPSVFTHEVFYTFFGTFKTRPVKWPKIVMDSREKKFS